MKFLHQLWTDVRKGENIDVYLTVLLCLVLSVGGIAGWANFTILASAILAVLAISATSTLTIRRAAQELRDTYTANIPNKLTKNSDLRANQHRLANAKTIDWLAVTMYRSLSVYTSDVAHCLRNGGRVRIILIDPTSDTPDILARLGYWRGNSESIIQDVKSTLSIVEHWKNTIPGCNIEVRYLCGQPPYRFTIVDGQLSIAYSYIRIPAFPNSNEQPVIVLQAPDDREWLDYFADQYEKHWNISTALL